MTKEINWLDAQIGQKVWHCAYGNGVIEGVFLSHMYPINVRFGEDSLIVFTHCGRCSKHDKSPSLLAGHNRRIDYGELGKQETVPLSKITKNTWAFVSDRDDYEYAKKKGKQLVLFDDEMMAGPYTAIAGGEGIRGGYRLVTWKYAWEIPEDEQL